MSSDGQSGRPQMLGSFKGSEIGLFHLFMQVECNEGAINHLNYDSDIIHNELLFR